MAFTDEIDIGTHQLDENGCVVCWDIKGERWIKLLPIDAKERILAGEVSLQREGDDADATKPNEKEVEAFYAGLSKSQIRKLCVDANVSHLGTDTKQSLIKRLISAGVFPV